MSYIRQRIRERKKANILKKIAIRMRQSIYFLVISRQCRQQSTNLLIKAQSWFGITLKLSDRDANKVQSTV